MCQGCLTRFESFKFGLAPTECGKFVQGDSMLRALTVPVVDEFHEIVSRCYECGKSGIPFLNDCNARINCCECAPACDSSMFNRPSKQRGSYRTDGLEKSGSTRGR